MKFRILHGALLATSSTAALLLGAGAGPAAACYTGPFPFVNSGAQTCISVAGTSFTGNITNNGTIAPGGISVTDSTITGYLINSNTIAGSIALIDSTLATGGIADNGNALLGGITVDSKSTITGKGTITTIAVSLGTFSGGISNSGTLTDQGSGIGIGFVSTFAGGITNSGSITAGYNGITLFHPSSFSGGIFNNGSIAASGAGIIVASVSNFSGGITNSGTITASEGILAGFPGFGISTFSGNITNSGTIKAQDTGIGVFSVSSFAGGISNSGNISAMSGIVIGTSSQTTLRLLGASFLAGSPSGVTVTGGIANSGTITAQTGISVNDGSVVAGGITNSGNITGSNAAIDITGEGAATTINQTGGTITGAILLSSLGDTVNISGGTINGNIVGSGSSNTINFALGAGNTFTYASPFGFSGINQVNINSGIVVLDGLNSANSVVVNGGGTLAGTGVVDPAVVTINAGGTLAPGPSGGVGTLTIGGNLAFQSGALYQVALNPTTASLTNVSGSASLSGNVLAEFAPGTYFVKKYTILTATGGLNGTTFAGLITSNAPANFAESLGYDANDVFLDLKATVNQASGLNENQENVANALNNFFNSGGALPPSFESVFGLTGRSLADALTQLSGEVATDTEEGAFKLMDQFLGLMLDPFVDRRCDSGSAHNPLDYCGRDGGQAIGFAPEQPTNLPPDIALAYAGVFKAPPASAHSFEQGWTAWGSGFGGSSTTNGNATVGSNNVTARDYGFAGGMDYHFSANTLAGFGLAGGGTSWGLAQGLGSGRSDAFQAGVYGKSYFGPAYVAAALAFTNNWFTTNRTALGDDITARFAGQSYGGRLETGYRYGVPAGGSVVGATPYAAIQTQWFHTPTYSETDLAGGGFGLTYNSMTANDTRSELGARFDDPTLLNGMPLILRARFAWAHDWVNNPSLNAVFQSLPGSSFIVNGATPPKNSALASAGAQYYFASAWSFTAKFDGEFAPGSQTYGGTGTLRYSW